MLADPSAAVQISDRKVHTVTGGCEAHMLPRLLYLSDVPAESSYHGSALIYRLLECYPQDRLLVVEGNGANSLPERRLPNVVYRSLAISNQRLRDTRFYRWHALWTSLRALGAARKVPAAEFARLRNLPLHLIVHDDWPRICRLPWPFSNRIERQFADVYCAAASRLCVSPLMVEEYDRRYGVRGSVLLPSRGRNTQAFDTPPQRISEANGALTFAFAGTINSSDYCRLLGWLAECLEPNHGQLLIFGPLTTEQAAAVGLRRPNIRICGLVKPDELMQRLRAEVDVLFVPMSFSPSDRPNMEISFPSKLTDYTAVGLPLLICGPEYCSAIRWARENDGVAQVVSVNDKQCLAKAVDQLARDPQRRLSLATAALNIGNQYFSHSAARQLFEGCLTTVC
jgi:hypothetical protein